MNGTNWHIVYAEDVNLIRENINNTKRNTEALMDYSKEVGLEPNAQ